MSMLYTLSVVEFPGKKNTKEPRTLQEDLTRCFDEQLFVDAEIHVQNKIFKAHKSILAFYSPPFQRAFYGTKNLSSVSIVNDVNPEGFEILLRFLYSSEIPDQAISESLVDACVAAQKLEMIGIKEKLINYIFCKTNTRKLSKPIVEKKFWSLLQKSHSLKFRELEEKLLKFAENHMKTVLNHGDFAKADSQLIKLVLDKATSAITESYKLERIAHWKDSNSNMEFLKLKVSDLLLNINFQRLTPKEFYTFASKHQNILMEYDALDILMHLVDPTVCSLPHWCTIEEKNPNITADLSMDKGTLNLGERPKTDKFKSLEDLHKIGNTNLISERKTLPAFQSQKDLINLDDFKTREMEKEIKFNILAESYAKTLPDSFRQMFEESLFTDVTLHAKDGTKIQAHRLILALGSEVFAGMLYGATSLNTLRLEETGDELKTMLKCFYGTQDCAFRKIPLADFDSFLRNLDVALKYDCYPLVRNCRYRLASTLMTPYIFWKLLDQADKLKTFKVITKELMRYALISPKKVFDHESFYRASKNSLVRVLESDFLNMPECDILEYVARWLENNTSTDHLRKELLKLIRLEALNPKQFFGFVMLHDDLFLKEDAFAILTFLFRESKESRLPEWCYRGPLRSFFYDHFSKIGTDILIPWKNTPEMGRNFFNCTYVITISEGIEESQVQYLELSWRVDPPRGGQMNYKSTVTIKDGGSKPLTFNVIQVNPYQRIIVPVFFTLNTQNPKIRFDIEVNSVNHHRYYFIRESKMAFDKVVFESKSNFNCISDAIVDNCTSEKIKIPKYLLPLNNNSAIPTEKCFKITTEDAA